MQTSTRITPRAVAIGAGVLGAAALAGGLLVGFSSSPEERAEAGSDRPVVMTEFPGLAVADGDPQLEGFTELRPGPGTVARAEGPFDDRFELSDLVFDGGSVSGTVLVTSDVSEVIELEVLAGFYDASGALIGDGSFVLESDHDEAGHVGPPEESHAFEVVVPSEIAGQAASAAVGVPVLVNE